jgi:hypothetical protein
MVKFTKQFEGQLVPEWKHAFVDYCTLKKGVKRMEQHALLHDHCMQETNDNQRSSLYKWLCFHKLTTPSGANAPDDHGVIQVLTFEPHRSVVNSCTKTCVLLQQASSTDLLHVVDTD